VTDKKKTKKKITWRRRLLYMVCISLTVKTTLLITLFSGFGERQVQGVIEKRLQDQGITASLGKLEYSTSGLITMGPDVSIKDEKGMLLQASNITVQITPSRLIHKHVDIESLEINDLVLTMAESQDESDAPESESTSKDDRAVAAPPDAPFQMPEFLSLNKAVINNASVIILESDNNPKLVLGGVNIELAGPLDSPVISIKAAKKSSVIGGSPHPDWNALSTPLECDLQVSTTDFVRFKLSGHLATVLSHLDQAVGKAIPSIASDVNMPNALAVDCDLDLSVSATNLDITQMSIDTYGKRWLDVSGRITKLDSATPQMFLDGKTHYPLRVPLSLLSCLVNECDLQPDGQLDLSNIAFHIRPDKIEVSEDLKLVVRSIQGDLEVKNLELIAKTSAVWADGKLSGEGEGSWTSNLIRSGSRRLGNSKGSIKLTTGDQSLVEMALEGSYRDDEFHLPFSANGKLRLNKDMQWRADIDARIEPLKMPAPLPKGGVITLKADADGPPGFKDAHLKNLKLDWSGQGSLSAKNCSLKSSDVVFESLLLEMYKPLDYVPKDVKLPPLPSLEPFTISAGGSYDLESSSVRLPSLSIKAGKALELKLAAEVRTSDGIDAEINLSESVINSDLWIATLRHYTTEPFSLSGSIRVAGDAMIADGQLEDGTVFLRFGGIDMELPNFNTHMQRFDGSLQANVAPSPDDSSFAVDASGKIARAMLTYGKAGGTDQEGSLNNLTGNLSLAGTLNRDMKAAWNISAKGSSVMPSTMAVRSEGSVISKGTLSLRNMEPQSIDGSLSFHNASVALPKLGIRLNDMQSDISVSGDLKKEIYNLKWNIPQSDILPVTGEGHYWRGLTSEGVVSLDKGEIKDIAASLAAVDPPLQIDVPHVSGGLSTPRNITLKLTASKSAFIYPDVKIKGGLDAPLELMLNPHKVSGVAHFTKLDLDNRVGTKFKVNDLDGSLVIESGTAPLSILRLEELSAYKKNYKPNLAIDEFKLDKQKIKDIRAEVVALDRSIIVSRLVCMVEAPHIKIPHRVDLSGWFQNTDVGDAYHFKGKVRAPSITGTVLKPISPIINVGKNHVEGNLAAYSATFDVAKSATAEKPVMNFSFTGRQGQDILASMFNIDKSALPQTEGEEGLLQLFKSGKGWQIIAPEKNTETQQPEKQKTEEKLIDTGKELLEGIFDFKKDKNKK
jgi:hypothetical protein